MKPFEREGTFALPGGDSVPGVLSVSNSRCELRLLGSFASKPFGNVSRYPVVHGDLHTSAPGGGTYVTLLDAFTRRISWSSASGSMLEVVTTNRVFIGDEHLEDFPPKFLEARFTLHGLSEWIHTSAFEVRGLPKEGSRQGVDLLPGSVRAFKTPAATVEFRTTSSMGMQAGADEVRVRKHCEVGVRPKHPISEEQFSRDYIIPIRNLVTLGTGAFTQLRRRLFVLRASTTPWPPTVRDWTPVRRPKIKPRCPLSRSSSARATTRRSRSSCRVGWSSRTSTAV